MSVAAAAAIAVCNASKRYGSLQAIDNVSLTIAPGEFFGLLGPNGAGKTTLISALCGLTRLSAGKISILGSDVVSDYRRARMNLGVVPQELVFDPFFSVRELLRIQSGYYGVRGNEEWIDKLLRRLDLTDKAEQSMRELSGGMKRRVLVAQALVHRPPVIVLDEPTAGVDVELRQGLWSFIRQLNEEGHTIVLTTHYLEEAENLCSRIAMLKGGRVVALDTTANLLARFASHRLRVRLENPQVGQRLGAQAVGGGWLEFALERSTAVEPLLALLRAENAGLLDVALGAPDLEGVFKEVMHRE